MDEVFETEEIEEDSSSFVDDIDDVWVISIVKFSSTHHDITAESFIGYRMCLAWRSIKAFLASYTVISCAC